MKRFEQIMLRARASGQVLVDDLAEELDVSPHTIRRDLKHLCERGELRRVHGGAERIDPDRNLPYQTRAILNHDAKAAIARKATAHVPDGATVFISIGSTLTLVAENLREKANLTVITNNLNAADALSGAKGITIIIPGGTLRLPDRDMIGPDTNTLFGSYRADFGFYGVGGIDPDGALLDFHRPEVEAREMIRAQSRQTILVADHSKFGRRAAAAGGWISEADHVVIDTSPEAPEWSDLLASVRDRLTIAREEVTA